jgi:1-acyl-sn-glycerol-3-phosphate acyltransferase
MVRFIFLNVFIALHSIVFSLLALILSLASAGGRLAHFYSAVPWAKAILRVCGVQVRVVGAENVESHIPRIYLTNHQSTFDIFALLAFLPVHFKFVVKQELMNIPVFGQAMRRAGYIGIERDDPRKALKSMNKAAERIRDGASVVIFPEGTRSADGRIQDFRPGAFHLTLKSGCDIVPITINGSHRIMPKGSFRINRGSFAMRIGKPIQVKGYAKKDMARLMAVVRETMIRQLAMDDGRGDQDV